MSPTIPSMSLAHPVQSTPFLTSQTTPTGQKLSLVRAGHAGTKNPGKRASKGG